MITPLLLLLVHAAATLAMVGLIWFVQVVHYPLFAAVGEQGFRRYAELHARRTTLVVAPCMLVELVTAVWLVLSPPSAATAWLCHVGFWILVGVWLSTALLQVPCHRRLASGPDPRVIQRLVTTNWLRTFAWSARGVVALALLASATATATAAGTDF